MMHPSRLPRRLCWALAASLLLLPGFVARGQSQASSRVQLTVLDENGVVVPDARVTLSRAGEPTVELLTDRAGRAGFFVAPRAAPYQLQVDKQGFYETLKRGVDPALQQLELVLAHEQIVRQQVDVVASTPNIDPQQMTDVSTMDTPEIVNIPYVTNRNIVNLLPYNPGVIQDPTGQLHVAGSPTYATLDLLDGFDLRSPASGTLSLHVSTDAVRSIATESMRYPVEYGRATGGVIAFSSGMGDNRFRFNTTDFIPSYLQNHGLHFDKFVPRVTFSGPIVKDKAWFFDGFDLTYAGNFVVGLPANADTDPSWQESNLSKIQVNLTPKNNLVAALLVNDDYIPFDGLSTLTPQVSTYKLETLAFLPYLRDQQLFSNGALLEAGIGVTRIHSGYEPHGNTPYDLTPEIAEGSYFENLTGRSSRIQESFALYLPPRRWLGQHNFQAGVDLDQIAYGETFYREPVHYLREDGTLLRLSTFPAQSPFTGHNGDTGAYLEDRWQTRSGFSVEPGLRFDWDEVIRRPLLSPRVAAVFAPGKVPTTKISAGIGIYYEHTQLEYLEEAFAGLREDTYFAADGVTPVTPALPTSFRVDQQLLRAPRVINSSVAIEQKLPAAIYASLSYVDKRGTDFFAFADQSAPSLARSYLLTNESRQDYHAVNLTLRHTFSGNYVLFSAYTHSLAYTNAAIEYSPTVGYLGPQQPGPLPWNVPNRVISWGWLPIPKLSRWDFVYTVDWRTGLPFTAIDAAYRVVGAPDSHDFPNYLSFSPGLEWKFHLRGAYFGLRGMVENITDRQNPTVVNNVVDSPRYGVFSEPLGRAFTARIRLIGNK
jgi:hypothetical protein